MPDMPGARILRGRGRMGHWVGYKLRRRGEGCERCEAVGRRLTAVGGVWIGEGFG